MTNKNRFLRRLVAAAFLFTIIASPLQVVFACDLIDGQVSRICCCGDQMGDGCTTGSDCDISSAQAGYNCCQISFDDSSSVSATSGSHSNTVHPPDDPQPRLPLPGTANPRLLTSPTQLALHTPVDPSWHRGTQTYLVTLRLRD